MTEPAPKRDRGHRPTAFLPDADPANGESCQLCGQWWPCRERFWQRWLRHAVERREGRMYARTGGRRP